MRLDLLGLRSGEGGSEIGKGFEPHVRPAPLIVGTLEASPDPDGEKVLLAAFEQARLQGFAAFSIPAGQQMATVPSVLEGEPLSGKRVLIVVENLPVPFDRRVWQEARTLKAAGASVSVICPKGRGFETAYEVLEGIEIHRHRLPLEAKSAAGFLIEYGAAMVAQFLLICRVLLRQRGIDVIQGCNPPDTVFLFAWPLRLLGVRYVFDHHDICPELFEAKFGRRGIWWRVLRGLERMTFRAADVSIATNDSYRRIAIERGGMKPEKVFVVRSGPDLSQMRPVEPVADWKNGRTYLVGYVGVMAEQEGIDLLIDAAEHLVRIKHREDIQFCLVGGGPNLALLQALVSAKGLDDYIHFTGRAPDQVLHEVLSTMDLGVNPDRVNAMNDKSTMNKIMEYMSLEKPIVQFDVTEGRYSAQRASLYARPNDPIDFADKVEELLASPERRARMGRYGRERVVNQLGWQHQIEPLINAYLAALQPDKAPRRTPPIGRVPHRQSS